MTDKEKIRKKIEIVINRRLNLLNGDYFDLNKEVGGFTNEIMDIINSLQEEPVSEDLEEAASIFAKKDSEEISNPANFYYTVADKIRVFKAGAKWKEEEMQSTIELAEDHAMFAGMEKMKEQLMEKAIDAEVKIDAGNYPYIPQMELYNYDKDAPLANEGDKYKVILIKVDEL